MLLENVKSLELALENCEGIIIPVSVIEEFDMSKNNKGEIDSMKITLDENAKGLEEVTMDLYSSNGCMHRLEKSRDITNLIINYCDGTESCMNVNWIGDDFTNELQEVNRQDGKFIIEIKQEKELYNIYIEKALLVEYIEDVKESIVNRDNKSSSDIGALNIMNRLSLDIKSGKFDKIL